MNRGDDLAELTISTQARIDDASNDHLYVGQVVAGYGVAVGDHVGRVGAAYDEDSPSCPARRVEALAHAVTQAVTIQRANGGVGRGVVSFRWTDEGLEASWSFWRSAQCAFDSLRGRAA